MSATDSEDNLGSKVCDPLLFGILGITPWKSFSPPMQEAALRAAGLSGKYLRISGTSAVQVLRSAQAIGLNGANVTHPHKRAILPLLDEISPDAQACGAVNTICFDDRGRSIGFNTDPIGVLDALADLGIHDFKESKAVVIGTGGAARAVAHVLSRQGTSFSVLGRDTEKARALAQNFGATDFACITSDKAKQALQSAHIIVSAVATKASIVPETWLPQTGVLLEANYGGAPSAILQCARAKGLTCSDGRRWLLHQGVASFQLWTKREADLSAMESSLNAALDSQGEPTVPHLGIALIGLSGAGKTSLGHHLAQRLHLPHLDTDALIEKKFGNKIVKIFETFGEGEFRRLEDKIISENIMTPSILSLGGGTLLNPENWKKITTNRLVVWLTISPEESLKRLKKSHEVRPLLHGSDAQKFGAPDEELSRLAHLMAARRQGFAQTAHVVVDATEPLEQVADEVMRAWHGAWSRDA